MIIHVEMTSEEFQEYLAWQGDKTKYEKQEKKVNNQMELMAKQVTWAVEEDPKKPGKYKIVDQDHMADLYDTAVDHLS